MLSTKGFWRCGVAVAGFAAAGMQLGRGEEEGDGGGALAESGLELPTGVWGDGLDETENPLLFDPTELAPIGMLEDLEGDGLVYGLPTIPPPSAEPEPQGDDGLPSLDDPLVQAAIRIAPSVFTLRAWDEFGKELANGTGFLISDSGTILTDSNLIHPEISEGVAYLTAVDGFGEAYEVSGVWVRDLNRGIALIKIEGSELPYLEFDDRVVNDDSDVRVIALKPEGGLVLADGIARRERDATGSGWLLVEGEDSPGAVGSPVIGEDGKVLGMVSMRLPGQAWLNYAIPSAEIMDHLHGGEKRTVSVRALKDVRAKDPLRDPELSRAYRHLFAGHAERATRQLMALTKTYPRSSVCWALLGLAVAELGAKEEALACQKKAVALDPEVGAYWLNLAKANLADQDAEPDVVEESLARAVERRPADRLAWLLLAEARIKGERYEDAVAALTQVLKIEPEFPRAHYLMGYALGKTRRLEEAVLSVERSLSYDRRNPEGWYLLGLLRVKEGNFREATRAFESVTRYDKKHPKVWLNLAHAYRGMGRENEARLAAKRHFALLAEL